MEYSSTKEVAKKWNMTSRRVQDLCRKGLIPDVIRVGRTWMIPAHAKRPVDRRKKEKKENIVKEVVLPRQCPMLLMSDLYHIPGSCDALITTYKDQLDLVLLLQAQILYFKGDFQNAYRIAKSFLEKPMSFYMQVGVGMLLTLCANARGDMILWDEAKQYVASTYCKNQEERYQLAFWLAAMGNTIDDSVSFPKWFQQGNFDLLPKDAFPFAQFFYIKYLLLISLENAVKSSNEKSQYMLSMKMLCAICEPLISQLKMQGAILPEIYLRLLCAIAYYNNGEEEKAIVHIEQAITLALPDQLLSPFAEVYQSLGFVLEDCLRKVDEQILITVRRLSKKMMDGWIRVHNVKLGRNKTNAFTLREREIARLAAYGFTNGEIANQLHISVNTVKQTLKHAMDKVGCKKRKDFINYI